MKTLPLGKAILLFMLVTFPYSAFAQEVALRAEIDQSLKISFDETKKPMDTHYKADATSIINQLGEKSDQLIELLTDRSMEFKLNKETNELEIQILQPVSLTEEWTVDQWNIFLERKMKRALSSIK